MKIRRISNKVDKAVVLFFFVALLGYMPTARSADRYVWIAALFLLLVRAACLFIGKHAVIRFDSGMLWYGALVALGAVTCLWAKDTDKFSLYMTTHMPIIVISMLCLGIYVNQRIDLDTFNYLIIIAGLIAAARYCYYTNWSGIANGQYIRGSFGKLIDNVTNYNNYSTPLCIVAVIAMYYAMIREKRPCYIALFILAVVLVLAGSRKNLVVLAALGFVFSLSKGNVKKKIKALLLALIVMVAGVYLVMTIPSLSQIKKALLGMFSGLLGLESGKVDVSTLERMYLMERAKEVWLEHPFFGVGWENYRKYNDVGLVAHNNYFELLASLGLAGFVLFYSKYLMILLRTVFAWGKHQLRSPDFYRASIVLCFMIIEYGGVTIYSREKLILLLMTCFCYNCATNGKVYSIS